MYFNERDVDQRYYSNSRVSSANSQDVPPYSYSGASYSPPAKVYGNRKGKWTTEEENYTNKVIWCFNAGTLPIAPDEVHVTLRSYLAEKLECDPMRITKKYTGASCLGKKVYRTARSDDVSPEQLMQDQMELQMLEKAFKAKLDQIRSKKMLQGMSSEARRSTQSKEAYAPSMDEMIRQSMLDNYGNSSSYVGERPGGPPKSLHSPTNLHYSLPSSLLQVTHDHYMEQLKNDAAASAANFASDLNGVELARIPSLNSELLFDSFGGPGSAFSSMGNLSGFASFFAPTTPVGTPGATSLFQQQMAASPVVTHQPPPILQMPTKLDNSAATAAAISVTGTPPLKQHKYNWIQKGGGGGMASNEGSPDFSPRSLSNGGVGMGTSSSSAPPYFPVSVPVSGGGVGGGGGGSGGIAMGSGDYSDSPSRGSHSLSPGAVINDEGHLPSGLLEHRHNSQQQLHQTSDSIGLPDVYRNASLTSESSTAAVRAASPATSLDDDSLGSPKDNTSTSNNNNNYNNKRKINGLASGTSSSSSSDSALGGQEFSAFSGGNDLAFTRTTATAAALSTNGSTEGSQPSPHGGSGNGGVVGFKKRKMSEDMTAAASSLLGFFSQFHGNDHGDTDSSNNDNNNSNVEIVNREVSQGINP